MVTQAAQQNAEASASPLERLSDLLSDDMLKVNELIISSMQSDVPMIPQLAGYLIASGGKRIRPLLTLASTQLFNGDIKRAHGLSAAVEFIHTATLLHDDVVDGSTERRGKQAANLVFGNQASVLVGDFLFSRAFQLMVKDGNLDVLRILSDASAIIAEGEVMQLTTANNLKTTMDKYITVVSSKTAALFAAACEIGPVIAGENKNTQQALRDYGLYLGIAFQIADDVLDYNANQEKLGKTVGDDFREGKMTAPIIHALQAANEDERAFWQRTIGDKNQTDNDLKQALEILDKHEALPAALDLATKYAEKAIKCLTDDLPRTDFTICLEDLAQYSVKRMF